MRKEVSTGQNDTPTSLTIDCRLLPSNSKELNLPQTELQARSGRTQEWDDPPDEARFTRGPTKTMHLEP